MDLLIFIILVIGGVVLLSWVGIKTEAAIATLVGALFGGAALMLGNWINRWNERRKAFKESEDRISKTKAIITAELVDMASALIDAKRMMDAAVETKKAGGSLPPNQDLTLYAPRPMSFTENLGSDLLLLENRGVDVLTTLRSNLVITRMMMDEISSGRRSFGYLPAVQLQNILRHDIKILSEAFEYFAPERQLAINGKEPELATKILSGIAE